MKTDNYLTLCLEQAAKSPLHYRHGCIVVRGGKVIGQGYNDYRPGFNGGALKHGRIANGSLDGPAMAELKDKLKKQKDRPKQQQQDESTFTPFEGISGGGHNANAPLSMHSEMMALHSALAASSTLSSTTFSYEKPCFKLSSGDKRKARLRREVLARYVATVCETSQHTGKLQVQECDFEADARQPGCPPQDRQQGRGEDQANQQRAARAGRTQAAGAGGEGAGKAAQTLGQKSGVSTARGCGETSEDESEEGEEFGWEESASVPVSVRPVWETDTAIWATTTATAICV